MGDPISLLVALIIILLFVYLLFWGMGRLAVPAPIRTVVIVVVALIVLVWLLQRTGLMSNL